MARSKPQGPLLAGARKLRDLLDVERTSVPDFCEANDLDRYKVQRLLNGTQRRCDVDFAAAIEDATIRRGRPVVAWFDWLTMPRTVATRTRTRTAKTKVHKPARAAA
jgi:hypothetical protein